GPHADATGLVIRTVQPSAKAVSLVLSETGGVRAMTPSGRDGLFETRLEGVTGAAPDYRLRVTFPQNHVVDVDDPYRYGRVLTDFDLYLFGEGKQRRAFEKLGAHRITIGSTVGVHFAVWAPNAHRVSVVGDFNGWDGRVHAMRHLGPSGVWEIFI